MKNVLRTALLVTVFMPLHAMAAPAINDAGANTLKSHIERVLETQTKLLAKHGTTLSQTGTLSVEPAGTYYAVTTPKLTITDSNKITQTLGMIAINAIPTDNPQQYKMAIALPTPLPVHDASGKQSGSITIGTQNMTGVYNFALQTFVELSANYTDIVLNQNDGATITIPTLTTRSKLTDQGQGLLSGPQQTNMRGFQYKDTSTDISIQSVDLRTQIQDFDSLSAPLSTNIVDVFNLASTFELSLNLTGIRIANTAPKTEQHPILAASSSITLSAKDIKSGNGTLTAQINAEGINMNNTPDKPTRASIKFNVAPLPAPTPKSDTPQTTVAAAKQPEALPFKDLITRLQAAGTTLTLENLLISSSDYSISTQSVGKFSSDALYGLSSTGKMSITSMPQALQSGGDMIAQSLAALTMLPLGSEKTTDANGKVTTTYNFEIGNDGVISFNGMPLIPPPAAANNATNTAPKPTQ